MCVITGPWKVQFDPQWFYPTSGLSAKEAAGTFIFNTLDDWSQRPEDAVRHFSGTAHYQIQFDAPEQTNKSRFYLNLGKVANGTAKVRLNGTDLGVIWCAPWQVDITAAVKPGNNRLEIDVVNLWPNRLIGDAGLPAKQRRTRTNIKTYKKNTPLLSSGLLGPVTIRMAQVVERPQTH